LALAALALVLFGAYDSYPTEFIDGPSEEISSELGPPASVGSGKENFRIVCDCCFVVVPVAPPSMWESTANT